jgi:hypothetical protein
MISVETLAVFFAKTSVAAHTRHRARLRHSQPLSPLKAAQRETGFQARQSAKRRRLDLAVEPRERLLVRAVERAHSVCQF